MSSERRPTTAAVEMGQAEDEPRDAAGGVAYLETDKAINVGFYERFGFAVIGEQEVLGVPNCFCAGRRPPAALAARRRAASAPSRPRRPLARPARTPGLAGRLAPAPRRALP
jgi:hypothetical protein